MKKLLPLLLFCLQIGLNAQVPALLDAVSHPKFKNPVPVPKRIPLSSAFTNVFEMAQTSQWLGLVDPKNKTPLKTKVWGYGPVGSPSYPGPTLVAKSSVPNKVEWRNNLPSTHLLPIDHSYHMAMPKSGTPAVVHLHGGHTEAASDGHPDAWYTASYGFRGPSWTKRVYTYDNSQEAATLWYHDHALGMTRLNVYAGLAGFYLLDDLNDNVLKLPTGNYDRELVIQDRMFTAKGELHLPSVSPDGSTAPSPSGQPEFFGDFILVNGSVWPYMSVEPRKYRFRLLNGSDSRVYNFVLSNGASFLQIASDDGKLNTPSVKTALTLSPGERAEIIVDFSNFKGQTLTLLNKGTDGPFGNPNSPPANPATTGQVMQFRVNAAFNWFVPNCSITSSTNLRPLIGTIKALGSAKVTRKLALFEGTDEFGRVLPMLGIVNPSSPLDGSLLWHDPTTENINLNDIETWEIYNTTADAHPIHLHLVSFQILSKQKFSGTLIPKDMMMHHGGMGMGFKLKNITLTGTPTTYAPGDKGWKDTHIIQPGEVLRVKAKFDRPGDYVWHCHILSHEDHDMMRRFTVKTTPGQYLQGQQDIEMVALAEPSRAYIQWVSNIKNSETDYFVVQKLNNTTKTFDNLAIVNNTNVDGDLVAYHQYDDAPTEGDNYYKVTAILKDGSLKESSVQKVTFEKFALVSAFPNPADGELNLDLKRYYGKHVSVYFYNQYGQIMQVNHVGMATNDLTAIDVAKLNNGHYLLRIVADGLKDYTKQIVVTH